MIMNIVKPLIRNRYNICMGLFIRNQDPRSELQSRVAAELQERLKERSTIEAEKVEPAFTEKHHHTRPAGVLIVALVVITVIVAAIVV